MSGKQTGCSLLKAHCSQLKPQRSPDDARTRFAPDGGLALANFVRSFRTCARIRSLTTGTFNLIVKDRIATRLSGANSVRQNLFVWDRLSNPVESSKSSKAHRQYSDRPRNPSNIPCGENHCQCGPSLARAQTFHMFSTMGKRGGGAQPQGLKPRFALGGGVGGTAEVVPSPVAHPAGIPETPRSRSLRAQRYGPSAPQAPVSAQGLFRPREGGRQKIEKRTFWRSLL
jgi:hypothetical protein